jgi:hypothetical protein
MSGGNFALWLGAMIFLFFADISSRISVHSGGRLGPFQTYRAGVVICWTRAVQKKVLALPDNCYILSRDIFKFEF